MKTKIVCLAAILVLAAGMAFAQEEGWTPFLNLQYTLGLGYNDVNPSAGGYIYGFNSGTNVGVSYGSDAFDVLVQAQLDDPAIKYAWITWKPTEVVALKAGLEESPFANYSGIGFYDNSNYDIGAIGTDPVLQLKLSAYGAYIALWDPDNSHVPMAGGFNGIQDLSKFDNPAFALGYDWANDTFTLGGGIAGTPVPNTTDIAFIFYLHGRVNIGDLYIALNAALEKAPGPFVLYSTDTHVGRVYQDPLKDIAIEAFVEGGYATPIGDLALAIGFLQGISDGSYDAGTAFQAGLNLAIPLTDYISIVPGVLYQNLLVDAATPKGTNYTVAGGVTFNVNF
jgi:hypothetical protein